MFGCDENECLLRSNFVIIMSTSGLKDFRYPNYNLKFDCTWKLKQLKMLISGFSSLSTINIFSVKNHSFSAYSPNLRANQNKAKVSTTVSELFIIVEKKEEIITFN